MTVLKSFFPCRRLSNSSQGEGLHFTSLFPILKENNVLLQTFRFGLAQIDSLWQPLVLWDLVGLAQSNKYKFPLWAQTFLASDLPESYIFLNSSILTEIFGYCNQFVLLQSFPYNTKFNLFFFRRSPDKSLSVLEHSITNLLFLSRATTLPYRYGDIYTASLCFYIGNTSAPTICQMTLVHRKRHHLSFLPE